MTDLPYKIKKTSRLVVFCIASFAVNNTFASPETQSLLDLFQLAKANDATWASAQSSNTAAQEKAVQGKALLLPSVTLGGSATQTFSDAEYPGQHALINNARSTSGISETENYHTYSYKLSISQPLYRKQNSVNYEQSKIQVAQADDQLGFALQDLILRLAQAYFDMLLAQDTIDLNEAQKAAISNQLEQAKVSFEVGTATITDVNDAQARYDLVVAQGISARNDLEVKKQATQRIIGQLPTRIAILNTKPQFKPLDPASMDQWVEIGERENLKLKIQQRALEIANQEVEKTHAGHYPTLDLVANYNGQDNSGSINGPQYRNSISTADIGLQVQVPLYQGGAITSREREAVANQQKARDDLEAARRQVDYDVRQAFLDFTSRLSQVSAYEQALNSSQTSLESTQLGYEVGVRTSVDVLNAQQQLFTSKRDLLQARYNVLLSKLKLKSASGLLTEADLGEIDQMLSRP
ncbi:outer membrane protein [Novimethylophilus kurashikiensis]|uniref:Outer membrane protein n=1 Tax=Novimethylophilus kurashikiensis TaxID=1825523 RepID=A0A2R5FJ10_9PROT|nr:TolC family outer membrane protein [Novimethylophilus kurashikiensis]GBG15871.1 outer membrane protein [Novimethylophilus kurashikiensis]